MVPLCFRRFLCPVLIHGPAGDDRVFPPPGGDDRTFPPPDGGYRRRTRSTTVTIGSVNSP